MRKPGWIGVVLVMMLAGAYGTLWSRSQEVAASAPATAPALQPEKLKLALVWITETQPFEFLFVVNERVGFKSVESLKKFVAGMVPGSTLTWDPGCKRIGNEPLLSSDKEMEAFKAFCAEHKVELVIMPGG